MQRSRWVRGGTPFNSFPDSSVVERGYLVEIVAAFNSFPDSRERERRREEERKLWDFQFLSGFQVSEDASVILRKIIFQFLSGFQCSYISSNVTGAVATFNSFPDSSIHSALLESTATILLFQFLSGFQFIYLALFTITSIANFQFLSGFQETENAERLRMRVNSFQFLSGFQQRRRRTT